jgi:hypothetical protein
MLFVGLALLLASCAHAPKPATSFTGLNESPEGGARQITFNPVGLPKGMSEQLEQRETRTPPRRMSLRWPELEQGQPGRDPFNRAVQQIVQSARLEFLEGPGDPIEGEDLPPSEFHLGYELVRADEHFYCLRFPMDLYHSGAAHPDHHETTLVFSRERQRVLSLEDLFQPDSPWLAALSARCTAELAARLEDSFFPEGAEPRPGNFERWLLDREVLTLLFDPYQVAPWSAGPQEVQIPLRELDSLLAPGIAKP